MSFEKEFQHLHIPLKDIKLATNNFGNDHCIGRGGFGKVYNGELLLSCGLTMVAIKRLDGTLGQGAPEFWKEIMMLSQYKHENIVSLLGFCNESGESILVYEYLSNKSLDLYIKSTNLSWNQRLHICIGAASGLQYLHDPNGTQQRVLHRDIKSANILLDQNWNAKISDFGLSKIGPANQQYTFLVSNPLGTIGYCDPLYMTTGYLTKESDIYSFGVVLFEVLCGRFCIENYEDDRRFLVALAQRCYKEGTIDAIIKSDLKEQVSQECLERFSTIAYRCLHQDRTKRPEIAEIVKELQIALQYQNGEREERNDGYSDTSENMKNEKKQRIEDGIVRRGKQQAKENSDSGGAHYIHVRAKRGQATNSHSLAERVRRERINERMKLLQELVPGCNKITGKAVMLDEIINYVQSLQQQVEFLSMKLATVNPELNIDIDRRLVFKDISHSRNPGYGFAPALSSSHSYPHGSLPTAPLHPIHPQPVWDNDLHNLLQMGFDANPSINNLGPNGGAKMDL